MEFLNAEDLLGAIGLHGGIVRETVCFQVLCRETDNGRTICAVGLEVVTQRLKRKRNITALNHPDQNF